MGAAATKGSSAEDRDRREQEAWLDYSESLRGLSGTEYDEAEGESWDRLQTTLRDLSGEIPSRGAGGRG